MRGKKKLKQIDGFEYKVEEDDKLFELPRKKVDKLRMLQDYVTRECENAWRKLPKKIAVLKREMLKELIDEVS